MKLNLSKYKCKELIPAEKKSLTTHIKDILEILSDHTRNYIFFDLETLGMHPAIETNQILEIAASVCHGFDTNDTIDSFHKKVKLLDSSKLIFDENSVMRDVWIKQNKNNNNILPEEILEMTKYSNNLDGAEEEYKALSDFLDFIKKFDNPILVAHNSGYDVKFLFSKAKKYGYVIEDFDVIDTLKICRYFFSPLLLCRSQYSVEKKIYEKLVYSHTDNKSISSRLGSIANALEINCGNWHTASADVQMLREVMYYIYHFMQNNMDVDISKYQKQCSNSKKIRRKRKTY